jgi:hypothetical protein
LEGRLHASLLAGDVKQSRVDSEIRPESGGGHGEFQVRREVNSH